MAGPEDPWERIRHLTVDQLITEVKLAGGSACALHGNTTPEGYPFAFFLAVGTTEGNMFAVDLVQRCEATLDARAGWAQKDSNPEAFTCPRCGLASYNPNDKREGYCARCHAWTGAAS